MLVLGKERAKELGVLKKSLHNRERFGATPQVSKHILVKTPLAAGRFPAIAAASSPAFNSSKLLGERTWRFLEIIEWKKVFLEVPLESNRYHELYIYHIIYCVYIYIIILCFVILYYHTMK